MNIDIEVIQTIALIVLLVWLARQQRKIDFINRACAYQEAKLLNLLRIVVKMDGGRVVETEVNGLPALRVIGGKHFGPDNQKDAA
jgi:hypothetical protein